MNYIQNGYVADGYIVEENTITPTKKVVSFSYNFVLDGTDITKNVNDFRLDKQLNRAYHIATLKMANYNLDSNYIRNENYTIDVTINNDFYQFIIYDVDRDYKNNLSLVLKTKGCLLSDPFSFKDDKTFTQNNSNDIFKELCAKTKLFDTSPRFNFYHSSFQKENSTDLEALQSLVKVFGGCYYDNNEGIVISKPLVIEDGATPRLILNDDILTSKVKSDNFDGSKKLHKIIINEATTEDAKQSAKSSNISIMMNNKGCNKKPYFTFNPSPQSAFFGNDIETNCNLPYPLPLRDFSVSHSTHLIDNDLITLDAGINKVTKILLDKVEITDYEFTKNYNVIKFGSLLTGLLEVSYETTALFIEGEFSHNGEYNSNTNERYFYVRYKDKEFKEFVKCDSKTATSNNQSSSSGGSSCFMDTPKEISSEKTTNLYSFNDSITKITFFNSKENISTTLIDTKEDIQLLATSGFDSDFINYITVTKETRSVSKNFTMEDLTAFMRKIFGSSTMFYFGVISTMQTNISFDGILKNSSKKTIGGKDYYYVATSSESTLREFVTQAEKGSFSAQLKKITIPKIGYANKVRGIKLDGCREEYIEIQNDINGSLSCKIPQTIKVNVAEQLSLSVFDIQGKEIDGYTIDSEGFISVYIDTATLKTIDCKNIAPVGTYIEIDARNAEES